MEFTKEMIAKAGKAASAEELMEMAKAEGFELTEADAEKYYGFLHKEGELTEEELSEVAGGKGADFKYKQGQTMWLQDKSGKWRPIRVAEIYFYAFEAEYWYKVYFTDNTKNEWDRYPLERCNVSLTDPNLN